jgi:SAM-dependent methyltransferase
MSKTTATVDHDAIKARQQGAWSSGDYAVIGTTLQLAGELLCEAVDVAAGERVLDVAAGTGNAALAAARRGAEVTACDYVPALLEGARRRAAADGLVVVTQDADAEALPFADDAFDVVLSTFGVMFTPDQERAANELLRTCRPGGRIGLANWTPDGFVGQIGQMFKVIGRYAPPPAGVRSPLEWGTEARLDELFAHGAKTVSVKRRQFVFRYRSAEQWLDTFRTYYGPTLKTFAALDPVDQLALEHELVALARENDTGRAGALRIPSAYFEVVVTVAS